MFSHVTLLLIVCLYAGLLYAVASWLERYRDRPGSLARTVSRSPWLYVLAFTIYNTSWTVYGIAGTASRAGMLSIAFYVGPTLMLLAFGPLLGRLIRIRNTYRVTSIADFLSLRYGRSQALASLITVMALTGMIPYIALQLRAILDSYTLLYTGDPLHALEPDRWVGMVITALLIVFTILFGLRRLDPTERHPGMMGAFAAEGVVKLVALVVAGVAITSIAFGNPLEALARLDAPLPRPIAFLDALDFTEGWTWLAYLVTAGGAVLFLPRQFHVAVVENENPRHVRHLLWALPLYCMAVSFFALPIGLVGMQLHPDIPGDRMVLGIPLREGEPGVAMIIFIGGVAAGTSMVMASTMALTTMVSNHLLMPLFDAFGLHRLKRRLLPARRITAAGVVLLGYGYMLAFGRHEALTGIGMVALLAALPMAAPMIGGLVWRRGNRGGALLSAGLGYLAWLYTSIVPLLHDTGVLGAAGDWLHAALAPTDILGMGAAGPIPHAVFWILLCSVGGYVLGSVTLPESEKEAHLREEILAVGAGETIPSLDLARHGSADIPGEQKYADVVALLRDYLPAEEAERRAGECFAAARVDRAGTMTGAQLAELHSQVQRALAGIVGAASAHAAVNRRLLVSTQESRSLRQFYADMLAELNISPVELRRRVDYYREREALLAEQEELLRGLNADLERRVAERTRELVALQEQMVQAARRAGMAEVATGVLHSVGNVLNSVNISTELVVRSLHASKLERLDKVVRLLREHERDLPAFLCEDHRGRNVLPYLDQLAQVLQRERDALLAELQSLHKGVDHMRLVVLKQQAYAKPAGMIERCRPADIVADALMLSRHSFGKHGIEVSVDHDDTGEISMDRHRVMQILINLISNAHHALIVSDRDDKHLHIHTRVRAGGSLRIEIADNGVGIAAEDRQHIFRHGFTTRDNGHGFGLHNSALAAEEVGGKLWFESGGPGRGAVFVLEIPGLAGDAGA